ncbi:MAG: helix-turn-helix domain-containing protein [Nanoarchaeota archaeon]|nr:helix-turn-helix domain-containing protein [Nanoarchaeota archaeon]MBU1103090.1 helix-turn-helix domain-containing protein [Nanoarchaeota archaeon]
MNEGSESWNERLRRLQINSGKSIGQLARETGIPRSTLGDYVHGKITDLNRISPERLDALYELTNDECFKYERTKIEMPERTPQSPEDFETMTGKILSNIMNEGKSGIDNLMEQFTEQMTGGQKLEAGLLKAQRYRPTPEQRAGAIMELLDVLSEEVDYFRTAPKVEKDVLVKRLQENPESFGYATQMLGIIYSGKSLDTWMLMAQPPSRLRNLRRDK